jgi:hypothetical protein
MAECESGAEEVLVVRAAAPTLSQAIGRTRHYAWEEISRLQVDPPGGPRILSVHLKSGGFRRLIRLQDDDVPQVVARWTAVEQHRRATRR